MNPTNIHVNPSPGTFHVTQESVSTPWLMCRRCNSTPSSPAPSPSPGCIHCLTLNCSASARHPSRFSACVSNTQLLSRRAPALVARGTAAMFWLSGNTVISLDVLYIILACPPCHPPLLLLLPPLLLLLLLLSPRSPSCRPLLTLARCHSQTQRGGGCVHDLTPLIRRPAYPET